MWRKASLADLPVGGANDNHLTPVLQAVHQRQHGGHH